MTTGEHNKNSRTCNRWAFCVGTRVLPPMSLQTYPSRQYLSPPLPTMHPVFRGLARSFQRKTRPFDGTLILVVDHVQFYFVLFQLPLTADRRSLQDSPACESTVGWPLTAGRTVLLSRPGARQPLRPRSSPARPDVTRASMLPTRQTTGNLSHTYPTNRSSIRNSTFLGSNNGVPFRHEVVRISIDGIMICSVGEFTH